MVNGVRTHGAPKDQMSVKYQGTSYSSARTRSKTAPEDYLSLSYTRSFHKRERQNTLRVVFSNAITQGSRARRARGTHVLPKWSQKKARSWANLREKKKAKLEPECGIALYIVLIYQ